MMEIKFDTKKLEQLIKALNESAKVHVKIGVLGEGEKRDDGMSNAEIGRIHEFGIGQHQRSFLRVPLMDHLNEELKQAGAFSDESVKQILREGSFKPFFGRVAVLGERIVQDAFDTSGNGKWPESNMANKVTKQTLVESRQLRRSITSKVEAE